MAARIMSRVTSPTQRLGIAEAAELLGVSRRTLYAWRAAGYGPRSVKYAGRLYYRSDDCYRWMAQAEAASAKGSGL